MAPLSAFLSTSASSCRGQRGSKGSEEQKTCIASALKMRSSTSICRREVTGGAEEVMVNAGVIEDVSSALFLALSLAPRHLVGVLGPPSA